MLFTFIFSLNVSAGYTDGQTTKLPEGVPNPDDIPTALIELTFRFEGHGDFTINRVDYSHLIPSIKEELLKATANICSLK